VQVPGSPTFSYTDLSWSQQKNAEVAYIPRDRLDDFGLGEEERCCCSFTTSNVVNYLESPPQNRKVAFKATFNCCYGPTDDRTKFSVTNLAASQPGKRRNKQEMGEGLKIGCKAHFRATVYFQHTDIVEIRMYEVCKAILIPKFGENGLSL
jgi:hypothetical protein